MPVHTLDTQVHPLDTQVRPLDTQVRPLDTQVHPLDTRSARSTRRPPARHAGPPAGHAGSHTGHAGPYTGHAIPHTGTHQSTHFTVHNSDWGLPDLLVENQELSTLIINGGVYIGVVPAKGLESFTSRILGQNKKDPDPSRRVPRPSPLTPSNPLVKFVTIVRNLKNITESGELLMISLPCDHEIQVTTIRDCLLLNEDDQCSSYSQNLLKIRLDDQSPSEEGVKLLSIISSEQLPMGEMTKCCDEHDICYDTCNQAKEHCDYEFKNCLYKICDKYEKTVGETVVKTCKAAAKMLFTGTITLGCKSYLDSQKQACYCTPNRKKFSYPGGEL
uniref:Group XIIA secretory phospholipase A2 n=1 Tax=Timema bartmani TaxID=61472 RepID=A0A7R9I8V1_9NEOP|nr:unnamed protein product [Timema bartmani]